MVGVERAGEPSKPRNAVVLALGPACCGDEHDVKWLPSPRPRLESGSRCRIGWQPYSQELLGLQVVAHWQRRIGLHRLGVNHIQPGWRPFRICVEADQAVTGSDENLLGVGVHNLQAKPTSIDQACPGSAIDKRTDGSGDRKGVRCGLDKSETEQKIPEASLSKPDRPSTPNDLCQQLRW